MTDNVLSRYFVPRYWVDYWVGANEWSLMVGVYTDDEAGWECALAQTVRLPGSP